MIVWGGTGDTTGGRYNPGTDTWNATSTGANVPSPRVFHTAVWTGTEMIVWGGDDGSSNNQFNTGERMDGHLDGRERAVPARVAHRGVDWESDDRLGWFGSLHAVQYRRPL